MNWNAGSNEKPKESLSVVNENCNKKQTTISYSQLFSSLLYGLVTILILLLGAPLEKRSEGGLIWGTGNPFGDSVDLYKTKKINIYNEPTWRIFGIAIISLLLISMLVLFLRHKHRSGIFDFIILTISIVALVAWVVIAITFDKGGVSYVSGGGISMEEGERNSLTVWYWIVMFTLLAFNYCHFDLLKRRKNAK